MVRCGMLVETHDKTDANPNARQANLLDANAGSPLLSITRSTYNRNQECIKHSIPLYRSDRTRFYISQKQRRTGNDWVLSARGRRVAQRKRGSKPKRIPKGKPSPLRKVKA